MLFIAFVAITAYCANWDDPTQTADQLLDGGETAVITPPAGMAATPALQRKANANKTSIDWTVPSTLSGGGNSAKSSRAQAETSTTDTAADTTSSAQNNTSSEEATPSVTTELPPSQTTIQPAALSLAGSWSLTLNDSVQRDLALTLFQNGNNLFGAGKIREGNNTLDVTVSGSSQNNETAELDISTVSTITLYKLNLNLNGDTATGDYQASSASGESWKGIAEGQKTA
jgi:hypothetical protein